MLATHYRFCDGDMQRAPATAGCVKDVFTLCFRVYRCKLVERHLAVAHRQTERHLDVGVLLHVDRAVLRRVVDVKQGVDVVELPLGRVGVLAALDTTRPHTTPLG